MSFIYVTRLTAAGGRNGHVRSSDGILDLQLAPPRDAGGKGGMTNPEQLFAAGYAASFESALLHVARQSGHRFADTDVTVVAEIGLSQSEDDDLELHAKLEISLAGVDQPTADDLVKAAAATCPFSKAIRGNVDVIMTIRAL